MPPFATTAGKQHLAHSDFRLYPRGFVSALASGALTGSSLDGGPDAVLDAVALVNVTFHEPNATLAQAVGALAPEVHVVGEARTQRFLTSAIAEGHQAARGL